MRKNGTTDLSIKIGYCLCALFILIALIFIVLFAVKLSAHAQSRESYENLASLSTQVNAAPENETEEPEELIEYDEFSPIAIDFDLLSEQSSDIIGWIYLPDSPINYPVLQAEDNSFYLHRLYDETYNAGGSIFADYECPGDFSGRNTIIYGHNLTDKSMFGTIRYFSLEGNQEYYEEHPVFYINTPGGNYKCEVFSCYVTTTDSDAYKLGFESDEDYAEFLEERQSLSKIETPILLSTEDRIVTLSTCSYEFQNARTVVHARLVRIG